ncbi:preprotein translocase subunit SecE [Terribacillus sp. 7520-G]|nr:preprotein translocase subunit SecE [Terribacillus sp. 7520-G]
MRQAYGPSGNEIDNNACRREFGGSTVNPVTFLKNVSKEMKKVSWPTGKELYRYTIVTVLTVVFAAIFFGLVDLGISEILNLFF